MILEYSFILQNELKPSFPAPVGLDFLTLVNVNKDISGLIDEFQQTLFMTVQCSLILGKGSFISDITLLQT